MVGAGIFIPLKKEHLSNIPQVYAGVLPAAVCPERWEFDIKGRGVTKKAEDVQEQRHSVVILSLKRRPLMVVLSLKANVQFCLWNSGTFHSF